MSQIQAKRVMMRSDERTRRHGLLLYASSRAERPQESLIASLKKGVQHLTISLGINSSDLLVHLIHHRSAVREVRCNRYSHQAR